MNTRSQKIMVVITTYNNPKSLELCLTSLKQQTFPNFEVMIADDGSHDETRELILRMKRECDFMIYHVWHPDNGYQKAKINNAVFRQINPKTYPVTVCIDHDVLLHPRFVEDHFKIHEKNNFAPLLFMGRRVDLSEALTHKITPENVLEFSKGLNCQLIQSALKGETKNVMRSLRLNPGRCILKILKRDKVYDLLGSNYSITTQALIDVNGYNEDFKSYWGEDGDLFVRVRNSGVKIIGRIGYAVQWHLYHKRLEETQEYVNEYQALLKTTDYVRCKNGLLKI